MPNEHSQTTVVVHLRSFVNSLFFAQLVDILNRRGTLTLIARILLSVASRSRAVSVARGGFREDSSPDCRRAAIRRVLRCLPIGPACGKLLDALSLQPC